LLTLAVARKLQSAVKATRKSCSLAALRVSAVDNAMKLGHCVYIDDSEKQTSVANQGEIPLTSFAKGWRIRVIVFHPW
jgi:hypothetical protein